MADGDERRLALPRETCGFLDENEAFSVQWLDDGRIVCYSYGKEAFQVYWIVVDSFYGTKKMIMFVRVFDLSATARIFQQRHLQDRRRSSVALARHLHSG